MKRKQMDAIMIDGANRRVKLSQRKAKDYSGDGDVLLNFKQVHQMCSILGIKPDTNAADTAMYFVVHKLQRLCNLRGKSPANESVLDTIDDIHNYIDLWYAVSIDKEG